MAELSLSGEFTFLFFIKKNEPTKAINATIGTMIIAAIAPPFNPFEDLKLYFLY